MTEAENEIVANAGVQLREIAQRLTAPIPYSRNLSEVTVKELVYAMDSASLSIAEVYGALSALPLDNEGGDVRYYICDACGSIVNITEAPLPDDEAWACDDCGCEAMWEFRDKDHAMQHADHIRGLKYSESASHRAATL